MGLPAAWSAATTASCFERCGVKLPQLGRAFEYETRIRNCSTAKSYGQKKLLTIGASLVRGC